MNNLIIAVTAFFIMLQSYHHLQGSEICNADHVSIVFEEYDPDILPFALQNPSQENLSQRIEGIAFRTEQDRAQFSPRYSEHTQMLKRFLPLNLPSSPSPNKLRKSTKSDNLLDQHSQSIEQNLTALPTTHGANETLNPLQNNSDRTIAIGQNLHWFTSLAKEQTLHTMPALYDPIDDNSSDTQRSSPYGSPTKKTSQKSWASYFCCCFFYK